MKQYIVLSHTPWAAVPTRTQQLITRLGEAKILFFQPADGPGDKSWKTGGRLVRPDVTAFTLPPDSPLDQRHSFFRARSLRRQTIFVERQIQAHHFREPVLWLTCPDQLPFLDRFAYRGLVYDCDRFWPSYLDEAESDLALAADVIFAASPLLRQRLGPCSPNVALLPNGVNFPMFSRPSGDLPPGLEGLSSSLLGWCGTVDRRLDLSPLLALVRQHPDWTVALLGPVEDCPAVRRLAAYENVRFLGPCSAVDLPDYLSRFQVLLNLRREGEENSDVIPGRIYEYLSTGRPIVSLLLPDEVEEFPDVIYGAHTPEEFVALCEKALREDPTWVSPRRKDYGAAAAWSRRAEEVRRILSSISL